MAVIGSMAAILIYERQRMREIEAETANINLVRRGINTAHRRITGLATLGEGVVNWNKAGSVSNSVSGVSLQTF